MLVTETDFSKGPLTGLRVLEMGQLIAGPFCGQLMADFGAEVIKIEPPQTGDPMRQWGRVKEKNHTLWWPVIARNKKSVTINLRTPEGQGIVHDLVAKSDFLIENFRPGTAEKWNLGYETLSAINPGLIMVRVSGFGQTGPYARRPGYGAIGEAMGGLRYVVGDPDRPPPRVGISIGDSLAATYACLGALMALHVREQTGTGQVIDSAIYEAVLGMMEALVPEYDQAGYVRERSGSILPGLAPSNVYPARDGTMVLIAGNQDTVFKRLAAAMGRPELAENERYATHDARGKYQEELDDLITEWSKTMNANTLIDVLNEHGVPNGQIYRASDMLADVHFKAREAIIRMAHPVLGDIAMQNVVPRLSDTPGVVHSVGPELGEHNAYVFEDLLGMNTRRLDALRERGVV